jgi:hypothetical protein
MKIYYLITLCISLLISLPTYAHGGHDHTSVYASFIHFVWLAPALIAVVLLYNKLLKKNYQIKTTKG